MNINDIKGVGPTLLKKLNNLGINTVSDIIEYYPYRYNFIHIDRINDILDDEVHMIKAIIVDSPKVSYIKRNFNRLSFKAISDDNLLNVVIFNRAFMKNNLTLNKEIVLIGKYNRLKSSFTCNDIKFNVLDNQIEPVYHLTDGITNNNLIKIINNSMYKEEIKDLIPDEYINKYKFISKMDATKFIHNPKNEIEIDLASKRLKYEELFEFLFKINYLKKINSKAKGIKRDVPSSSIDDFSSTLPFELTKDQIDTIKDIYKDLTNSYRMNRLVLGDVGSGKTIVATYAIYLNFLSHHQSALMAPTEILAEQHYNNLKSILDKFNIKVELLTGSLKQSEKKKIYERLKNNDIDLLIGTHALISEGVEFRDLTLVVVDEQHRFGVGQRNTLEGKGITPDVLYLSATPIPRTYALTIYGDLEISLIKEKPKGRKEIITNVVKVDDMAKVLYKMLEELKLNHQIYVVSPSIETDEESNLTSVYELKEKLDLAFHNLVPIGILHGKLKQNEKDKIMNDFKNNKIKILISTTVIEVGVDVKNSTMMVIYNSERFGLATLHQLRGRVGRNDVQCYCYLICNSEIERLKVLEQSNDGFYITEKDLEMRGHGDFFGARQSGDIPFKIASLKDKNILLTANKDAKEYLDSNKYLENDYYKDIVDNLKSLTN